MCEYGMWVFVRQEIQKRCTNVFFLFCMIVAVLVTPLDSNSQAVPGDIFVDTSSRLDARDLFLLSQEWRIGSATEPAANDLNGDGVFDALDLLIFRESFHFEFDQPTPTPTSTLTPTNTPGDIDTPTPTPTNTPIDTPTPTPTDTPFPTPTPTREPGPGAFEEFLDTFDDIDSVTGTVSTLDSRTDNTILTELRDIQGRVADNTFDILPWLIVDTSNNQPGDLGVAKSQPKSISFNNDPSLFFYDPDQASIIQINRTFNTSQAIAPRISFDIAFVLDQPLGLSGDFITVEVLRQDSDTWELIDLNGDGQIVSDVGAKVANTDTSLGFQTPGAFDALYDSSVPGKDRFSDITEDDFIHIEAVLPQDEALLVAVRFQEDGSQQFEGGYLDNLRVFDAVSGGGEPIITQVVNRDGGDLFADTENRVTLQGQNLGGAGSVTLIVGETSTDITDIQIVNGAVQVTLPRQENVNADLAATLVVHTGDGSSSEPFAITLNAAPAPQISDIAPFEFFLEGGDTFIELTGNHFRPAFDGADAQGGSIVTVTQDNLSTIFDTDSIISVNANSLVFDAARLAQEGFQENFAFVQVQNQLSGLQSNVFTVSLREGSGAVAVDTFLIQVGSSDPTNGFIFDPNTETFPLQTDHALSFFFEGAGFIRSELNISIGSKPIIENGQLAEGIDPNKATLAPVFESSVQLFLAPNVIEETGTLNASIQIGNGQPVLSEFTILAPLPPILFERPDEGDWASQDVPSNDFVQLKIVGDNFRGNGTGNTDPETFTRFFLLPVDGSDPIPLPEVDPQSFPIIPPVIEDAFRTQDEMFVDLEPGTIPPGEYRMRAQNPDSGLAVDSPEGGRTVVFTE